MKSLAETHHYIKFSARNRVEIAKPDIERVNYKTALQCAARAVTNRLYSCCDVLESLTSVLFANDAAITDTEIRERYKCSISNIVKNNFRTVQIPGDPVINRKYESGWGLHSNLHEYIDICLPSTVWCMALQYSLRSVVEAPWDRLWCLLSGTYLFSHVHLCGFYWLRWG